jgi:LL-diaminopimelate aminotransferase
MNPFAKLNQRLVELAAAGKDVIRLDMGSPDLPPPSAVIDALAHSAQNIGNHGYMPYRGDPGFRRSVAAYYQRRFSVEVNPNTEVLPLIGSKEGIANLTMAYLDRGDVSLVPELAYPTYSAAALMAGADPVVVPMNTQYLLDFSVIPTLPGFERAKLLWINYPNNPTGAVADLNFFAQAVEFCREHGLLLCSDNPYCDVTFDGYVAPSALEIPGAKEMTVEFMSLSKSHNMAGWRLGACVGSSEALGRLLHIKSTIDSASFRAIFDAGSEALSNTPTEWIAERNHHYQVRRDMIMAALPDLGLAAYSPHGSLYIWARILNGMTDKEYCTRALEESSVSITPGTTYGEAGNHSVRFSLGVSEARLEESLGRLRQWYRGVAESR